MNLEMLEQLEELYSLDTAYLRSLHKYAISNDPHHQLFVELEVSKILATLVPCFNYDYFNPPWLVNCTFDDDIWYIERSKNLKVINFRDIYLYDGSWLINTPFLKFFKLWLAVATSPKANSGNVLKKNSLSQILKLTLVLIDGVLLNARKIALVERGLHAINSEFFKDLIITIAKFGLQEGVYDFNNTIARYLSEHTKKIDIFHVIEFEKKYPHNPNLFESTLKLTDIELRKAKLLLFNKKAYRTYKSLKTSVKSSTFNEIYKNTLAFKDLHFANFPELSLSQNDAIQKYASVPTKSYENINLTRSRIINIVGTIETVNIVFNILGIEKKLIKIDLPSIFNHVQNIETKRTTTLPSKVIFKSFQDAFIFVHKYMDGILLSMLKILQHVENIRTNKNSNYKDFKENTFKNYIDSSLQDLHIMNWSINEFSQPNSSSKNIGLAQAYQLLIGCISILIGTVMARRQSEIISLSSTQSLYPLDSNPYNSNNDFFLSFHNAKSGVGGHKDLKDELTLPIPLSIAKIVFKLQEFNKSIFHYFPNKKNSFSLLSSFDPHDISFGAMNQTTQNRYLNYFCDYFDTDLISNNGITQRYYIRHHQLRRFFAMLFFWANSFDGLDSLRKFLGHTRMDHIYHYITESTPGAVLLGVKAQYLLEHLNISKEHSAYIHNIEAIEPILKKYFSISYFDYVPQDSLTIEENIYNNKEYLEDCFYKLLSDSIIDIKPMFFNTKEKDKKTRSFKLLLIVNENESIN